MCLMASMYEQLPGSFGSTHCVPGMTYFENRLCCLIDNAVVTFAVRCEIAGCGVDVGAGAAEIVTVIEAVSADAPATPARVGLNRYRARSGG